MNYFNEDTGYHPRYSRSEYDELLELERRKTRRGLVGFLLVVGCVVGFIYTFA